MNFHKEGRGFFPEKTHRLSLQLMKIAAYVSEADGMERLSFKNFIVETFFLAIQPNIEHTYIIITDKNPQQSFSGNTKIIIKSAPKNVLLKKLWWNVKLPAILKKQNPDLFISFDNVCSSGVSLPQIIVVSNAEKTKPLYLKKARLIIVNSRSVKKILIDKYDISENKILIIYPWADKDHEPIDTEEKERVKKEFSDDKEYFLYNGSFLKNEDLINLLKSFSHFKKRQQSNFKLLLLMRSYPTFEKIISDYKYRADVKFIDSDDKKELTMITAAGYAVILPFNTNEELIPALNSMQAGVPVIASKDSISNEVAGDAALYAETGAIKDIGEKMMQVYTDENYRSKLIDKGIAVSNKFKPEKAAESLWQAILKALE